MSSVTFTERKADADGWSLDSGLSAPKQLEMHLCGVDTHKEGYRSRKGEWRIIHCCITDLSYKNYSMFCRLALLRFQLLQHRPNTG
jgi:hypothetical protein